MQAPIPKITHCVLCRHKIPPPRLAENKYTDGKGCQDKWETLRRRQGKPVSPYEDRDWIEKHRLAIEKAGMLSPGDQEYLESLRSHSRKKQAEDRRTVREIAAECERNRQELVDEIMEKREDLTVTLRTIAARQKAVEAGESDVWRFGSLTALTDLRDKERLKLAAREAFYNHCYSDTPLPPFES